MAASGRYHHGNLRAALVETAVELARAEGPDGVVLREVARRTGVSHNAAYRHFSDRAQLLAEVAVRAMDTLEASMRRRIEALDRSDHVGFARASLRETGRAYVGFALAEQGLFRVAFTPHLWAAAEGADHGPDRDGGPYGLLNQALDGLVEAGLVTPDRRRGADVTCWSAVHGFSVLHLEDGPMADSSPEEREAALEAVLSILEAGLVG